MSDDRTKSLELLLEWYVGEINISRRVGWKHGDPPPVVMNVARFFNDLVGDFPQHRCERWFDRGLRCPFGILENAGFVDPTVRHGDPPDDVPPNPVRSPTGGPKLVVPGRKRASALAEAEAVVAASAEKVPVSAGRTLRDELMSRGPLAVGVGVAAGVAIRAAAKGFAGGGFNFPSVFDPKQAFQVR